MRFPVDDTNFRKIAFDDLENLRLVCNLVDGRDCVVQAGGNVGIFPRFLVEHGFKRVITFEPDAENFECLLENCTGVEAHLAALGDEPGFCRVVGPRADCGSLKINPGDDIPVVTIDSLGLDACDLIYLDIEGSEHRALLGARETLERYRPVLAVENKGMCPGFMRNKAAFREFVESLGYCFHGRLRGDDVFLPCA